MRAGIVGTLLAVGLAACGAQEHGHGAPGSGSAPPVTPPGPSAPAADPGAAPARRLALSWVDELHVPGASLEVLRVAAGGAGDRRVAYVQRGPTGTADVLRVQRRERDGTLAWDRAVGSAGISGLAVTPLGNTLLAAAALGTVDVGLGAPLALTATTRTAVVKLTGAGAADWQLTDPGDVLAFATDSNGSAIFALSEALWMQPSSVAKVRWDGSLLWKVPAPGGAGYGALLASVPSGILVAANAGPFDPAGGAGATLSLLASDGGRRWTRTLEHVALLGLAPAPDGGAIAWGAAGASARWAFASVGPEPAALFSIAPDGTLRWSRPLLPRGDRLADVAVAPSGRLVVAAWHVVDDAGTEELRLGLVERDGGPRFVEGIARTGPAVLHYAPGSLAYDGDAVTLALVVSGTQELAGAPVTALDVDSPVLLSIVER